MTVQGISRIIIPLIQVVQQAVFDADQTPRLHTNSLCLTQTYIQNTHVNLQHSHSNTSHSRNIRENHGINMNPPKKRTKGHKTAKKKITLCHKPP